MSWNKVLQVDVFQNNPSEPIGRVRDQLRKAVNEWFQVPRIREMPIFIRVMLTDAGYDYSATVRSLEKLPQDRWNAEEDKAWEMLHRAANTMVTQSPAQQVRKYHRLLVQHPPPPDINLHLSRK